MVAHIPDTAHNTVQVEITAMAHGGEGIARVDNKVVFVEGGLPGDIGELQIHTEKKSFARGVLLNRSIDSPMRAPQRCQAAAHGAGCCGYGEVHPESELQLKTQILQEQLQRIAKLDTIPEVENDTFGQPTHWRTRVRVGTDAQGRPGFRARNSRDLIVEVPCAQMTPKLQEAVFGGRRFSPRTQVVAVEDGTGTVHLAEVAPAGRAKRSENVLKVIVGEKAVVESITADDAQLEFTLPITGFWQAHRGATQHYAEIIQQWLSESLGEPSEQPRVGWDLYGGVGAFAPAIALALAATTPQADGTGVAVHSVESSSTATASGRTTMAAATHPVLHAATIKFHAGLVHKLIGQLPAPNVVVLDPPRSGAGTETISAIAQRRPQAVVHIGCDPATMARDLHTWQQEGYTLTRLRVINAFPGTFHSETIGLLLPAAS